MLTTEETIQRQIRDNPITEEFQGETEISGHVLNNGTQVLVVTFKGSASKPEVLKRLQAVCAAVLDIPN